MNGLPYYKAYPRDFFEGTIHLSFEVKSTYRLLLDLIYMHGGKLYDEPRFIAGQFGCSVKRWNMIRADLIAAGKISVMDGFLRNLRADKELEILRTFQDKQRENASGPRKINGLGKAMAEPKASHTEPEPDTEKREAKASPKKRGARLPDDWFLPKAWGEWAVGEGYDREVVRTEAANFKDYWTARAGPTATKLDWEATWRVWMRKAPKASKQRGSTNAQFGAAIHQLADHLSAGTARIDLASRDPFAVRPGPNPAPDEQRSFPLLRP